MGTGCSEHCPRVSLTHYLFYGVPHMPDFGVICQETFMIGLILVYQEKPSIFRGMGHEVAVSVEGLHNLRGPLQRLPFQRSQLFRLCCLLQTDRHP